MATFPRMEVLGVPIDLVNLTGAVARVLDLAQGDLPRTVFLRDVASLMLAVEQPDLMAMHRNASLILPDGMPLVWIGRLRGHGHKIGRVAGADLMDAVCEVSQGSKMKHFFYGGAPGVADELARRLVKKYPELEICGTFSPPMRDIGPFGSFDSDQIGELEIIKRANPDFTWVGISSPKQERWMVEASQKVGHGVFLGVGAAFDFHSGAKRRAPAWMRNNGFEWLHRLGTEPARLWRRYLILVPKFFVLLALSAVKKKIS